MRLLWEGTLQKADNKTRGRERNVSIVAFLTPKNKGNPRQGIHKLSKILQLCKAEYPTGKNINESNPSHLYNSIALNYFQNIFTNIISAETH